MPVVARELTLPIGLPTVPEMIALSNNRSPDGRSRLSISGVVALQYIPYDMDNHPENACIDTASFDTISQLL